MKKEVTFSDSYVREEKEDIANYRIWWIWGCD